MTQTAEPGTVRLHRILAAPPERVYRAFVDPAALTRWLPPYGFTATMHAFTPGVGGGYRMSFTNFSTGSSHAFTVKFVELVENERIRHTDTFDAPGLPGEMQVTISLKKSIAGTELQIVQAGIPAAIPVDMCHLGWRESLEMLAKLVEPEIPDGG
ncbi:SRPBCC family protein [Luteimonas sp. SDU82]|uniref:SRPBCC family protein n=1 Tax=Luteimonas sp. SDU82 TaxID=3422592 RepID=UPI003EBD4B1A